ncbi:uncharacterized protein HaLaN_09121, partial [Haematococcus lacustris]
KVAPAQAFSRCHLSFVPKDPMSTQALGTKVRERVDRAPYIRHQRGMRQHCYQSLGQAPSAPMCADVVKVRLQLASNAAQASGVKPPGMVATGLSVLRNEGVTALWSGLGPSLARGFFFGGARLGLYTPIKSAIMGGNSSSASFELKAAGKTPGAQKTSMGVIRAVMAADGVAGLWKGAMPGLFRSAILTASQCATYDEVKRGVLNYTGWSDGTHTHFTSSMIAGLVTTTITNPLDVIKTRMFVSGGRYKGALECASHVLKTEGPIGFMKPASSMAVSNQAGSQTNIVSLSAFTSSINTSWQQGCGWIGAATCGIVCGVWAWLAPSLAGFHGGVGDMMGHVEQVVNHCVWLGCRVEQLVSSGSVTPFMSCRVPPAIGAWKCLTFAQKGRGGDVADGK